MGHRQLTIDFDNAQLRESRPVLEKDREGIVLNRHGYVERTLEIWRAVDAWIVEYTPAHSFSASRLGVYDKTTPADTSCAAETDQMRSTLHEYDLAVSVAIAAAEASSLLVEHGHSDDAGTLVRAYYLAVALNTLDYDLEHYLPGMPVLALENLA
tara:strand:+ start:8008 stop:8472 length:465 start_codon:yes stop_codon:yes gene_type:complete